MSNNKYGKQKEHIHEDEINVSWRFQNVTKFWGRAESRTI